MPIDLRGGKHICHGKNARLEGTWDTLWLGFSFTQISAKIENSHGLGSISQLADVKGQKGSIHIARKKNGH